MAAQKAILIGEDMAPLKALEQAAKEAFRRIGTVKQAYGTLNMGEFNQEVYNTAIVQGKIEQIRQRYTEEARQAVERLNIPNPQIRQNMLAGTGELFNSFADACHYLKQCTFNPTAISGNRPFPLEVVTIVEAEPTITDEAKAAFVESHCRTYVSTEQEHRAYQQFKEMQTAANNFNAMLKEAGIPISLYNFNEWSQMLTKAEDGTVAFNADTVKWLAARLK